MDLKNSAGIHESMVADRYRKEQDFIRGEGVKACEEKNLAIETHAGVGNLSKLYKSEFKKVLTNDINPKSSAQYNMKAVDFIEQIVNNIPDKIDFVDIDAYSCPEPEVKALFSRLQNDVPVVLCISDGLGLWMKRTRKIERIKQRFLLDRTFLLDERYPWRQHKELWYHLLNKLANEYGLQVKPIAVMQTKGLNYVLGSYLITK